MFFQKVMEPARVRNIIHILIRDDINGAREVIGGLSLALLFLIRLSAGDSIRVEEDDSIRFFERMDEIVE